VTQHLPAILIIIGTLAVYAFYVMFAVAGVVLAINYMLELLHRLLKRVIRSER
jgi:NADH:ubiquinone oxidoreductase subunit 4 (subunit M)